MAGITSEPSIISPLQNAHVPFSEPLSIKWDANGHEVIRFYLRVGTSDSGFDLFSAEIGENINHLSLDISSLPPNVESLYLKLAYTQMEKHSVRVREAKTNELVEEGVVEEVEMEPEEPLVIHRKK